MTGKAHEWGKRAAWELAGRKPRSEDEEILSLPQVSAWRWDLRPLGAPGREFDSGGQPGARAQERAMFSV